MKNETTVRTNIKAEVKGVIPGCFVGVLERIWSDRGTEFVVHDGAAVSRYTTLKPALRKLKQHWPRETIGVY